MLDMLSQMASDRLWIYTGIAGSIFGAAFLFWFKDTRMAIWAVGKFDSACESLAKRWGWTWLQSEPDVWRKKYPHVTKKIDELEARIKDLEETK